MPIELPVLRLGLAGFSAAQRARVDEVLLSASTGRVAWQLGEFTEADAWWVNGARTQMLADNTLRIASGVPTGRSISLNLQDVDRPVAFSTPLAPRNFEPALQFDLGSSDSLAQVLGKFEAWLQPLAAQFCLASHLLEHESALGSGIYHVTSGGALLAVVNLQGGVGVLPTAGSLDFEDAIWTAHPAAVDGIPGNFVQASLSQLMWQYALRTSRDHLPRHYRLGLLYFRRPPRLPQRMLRDSHLLLMRELAVTPATYAELQHSTGFPDAQLAHDLAALYLVGAITANARRAGTARLGSRRPDAPDSVHSVPSGLRSQPGSMPAPERGPYNDLTAPAPLNGGNQG
jgi:hypothetical protein